MKKKGPFVLSLVISLSFAVFSFAETIVLKSGKTIEGAITERADKYIKIEFQGVPLTYFLDEIDSIDGEKITPSKAILKNLFEAPAKKNIFYPLTVGNTWHYNLYFASSKDKNSPIELNKSILIPQTHIVKITGKENIDGNETFIQEMYDGEGKLTLREYLSEKENFLLCHKREIFENGIKKYDKIYFPPEANARYDLNPGDKWTGEEGAQFEFIGKEGIDTPSGKFEAYVFEISTFEDGEESHINKYYAPEIGLVSEITVIKAKDFNSVTQTKLIKYSLGPEAETPPSFADGLRYLKNKQYQQAIDEFQKTIQQYPDSPPAYNNLGVTYDYLGQHQQAVDYYQKAIQLDPNYAEAYANLGGAYNHLSKYQEAADACQKAIQLNPDSVKAYKELGLIYYSLGQYQQSVDYYQEAIERDPGYVKAYSGIAISLSHLGRYNEAIPFLQKGIEIDPGDVQIINYLGSLYVSLGQFEQALIYQKKAIEIDPNCAEAYLGLGVAFGGLGRRSEVIQNLQKAKELFQQKGDSRGIEQVQQLLDTLP